MLLEDQVEPLCREIVHFLRRSDAPISSKWDGSTRDTDLIPRRRSKHDEVMFVSARNSRARMFVFRVSPGLPDPKTLEVFPKQVLEEKPRADASVTIDNLKSGRPSEPHMFRKSINNGRNELQGFDTAFESEQKTVASAKAGVEGVAEAEVSTEVRNMFRAAYTQQTSVTEETSAELESPFVADPHTLVEAYIRWTEQTFQRRMKMKAMLDFGFTIGRWHRKSSKWASGAKTVKSLDDLIACVEQRGNPEMGWVFHHYARRDLSQWARKAFENIKKMRLQVIDKTTPPIKGADAIKIGIAELIANDDD